MKITKQKWVITIITILILLHGFTGCSLFEGLTEDDDSGDNGSGSQNLVVNGDFSDGTTNWTTWDTDSGDDNTISVEVVNGEYQITTSSPTDNGDCWKIGTTYVGGLNIENGKSYKVTFDARSNINRSILIDIDDNDAPYPNYSPEMIFDLTTTMTTYSFNFTMYDASDSLSSCSIMVGDYSSIIYLDNLKVEEISGTFTPPANILTNGDFSHDHYRWSFIENGTGAGSWNVTGEEMVITITNSVDGYGDIILTQGGVELLQSQQYRVSFTARCSGAASKNMHIDTGGYTQDFTITSSNSTYSYDFTMTGTSTNLSYINVCVGGDNTDVILDDISIIKI